MSSLTFIYGLPSQMKDFDHRIPQTSIMSFFSALSTIPSTPFPTNFIWNSRVQTKVKPLIWLAAN